MGKLIRVSTCWERPMTSDYQRFREVVESVQGGRLSSPFASLVQGIIDYPAILACLKRWEETHANNDLSRPNIREWLRAEVDPEIIEQDKIIPESYLDGLRSLGCLKARIPKKYGGLEVSQVEFSRVLQLIASRSEVLALVVSVQQLGVAQGLLSLQKLEKNRTAEEICHGEMLRKRYLGRLADRAIGAFCLTTAEAGSDPSRLKTEARISANGKTFLLNGSWNQGGKLYTTLGTIANVYVMLAVVIYPGESLDSVDRRDRISAFLVERETPGLSIKSLDFCGWHGLPNAAIALNNVCVDAEQMIGRVGDGLKIAFMNLATGRINIAAICLGMMKQLEYISRWWGVERVQGGKLLGQHQLNAISILNMNASIYATESFLRFVSDLADTPSSDTRLEAAMLKLFASQELMQIADDALQLRGGRGYETFASQAYRGEIALPVERLYRSARLMKIGEGGSNILMLYISRCLLDGLLRDYQNLLNPKQSIVQHILSFFKIGYRYFFKTLHSGSKIPVTNSGILRDHVGYIAKQNKRFQRVVFSRLSAEVLHYGWRMLKSAVATQTTPDSDVLAPMTSFDNHQQLLAHFACIAMYLSVMTVTLTRAINESSPVGIELADYYCNSARCLIETHYLQMRHFSRQHENHCRDKSEKTAQGGYADVVECDVALSDSISTGSIPRPLGRNKQGPYN